MDPRSHGTLAHTFMTDQLFRRFLTRHGLHQTEELAGRWAAAPGSDPSPIPALDAQVGLHGLVYSHAGPRLRVLPHGESRTNLTAEDGARETEEIKHLIAAGSVVHKSLNQGLGKSESMDDSIPSVEDGVVVVVGNFGSYAKLPAQESRLIKAQGAGLNCGVCGKGFQRRSNLFKHIRHRHERQRLYRCNTCQSTFVQRSSVIKHISTIHAEAHTKEL
ncbi:Zinc finger protein 2 [Porphyridium purpureum]|uniref:Zinc finger protein 2 n=1 Tax=Porphyridium purpureum TaxID=35688 RepID=A0A5J4Z283_PORPP|nr:Zinc finger protein 2 [Porphyridium purpureum]|eukprot:POR0248..scf295_1